MPTENGTKETVNIPGSVEIDVGGGVSLTMRPLTIKGLRQIVAIVSGTFDNFSKIDPSTQLVGISDIVFENFSRIMHVLFPPASYPMVTDEFIEDHIDLPAHRKIIEKAIEINNLTDVYPFLKKMSGKKEAVS